MDAVPLVGDRNRGDAAPPRPLELRLGDGRRRARQSQHRKRCDQQAEGDPCATHSVLLPWSLFVATLRCVRGPVMTTIDPLLALVTRQWDDQIWLSARSWPRFLVHYACPRPSDSSDARASSRSCAASCRVLTRGDGSRS